MLTECVFIVIIFSTYLTWHSKYLFPKREMAKSKTKVEPSQINRVLRLDVDSAASASAFLSPFTSTYSRGKNPYFFTFYLANNFDSSDSNSGSSGLLATSPMDL